MVTWTDLKRSNDIILAVWPSYKPLHDKWFMYELVEKDNLQPFWRLRYLRRENDSLSVDHHSDREVALTAANLLNVELKQALEVRQLDAQIKKSLQLKTEKALQSKKRLADEEDLMLAQAIHLHKNDERIDASSLTVHPDAEIYRDAIHAQLEIMPYLDVVRVGAPQERFRQFIIIKNSEGTWSKPYMATEKSAAIAERAKIAHGYSLSETMHWGKAKAAIREKLLPRANQLLQLASVQRLLAEALARGERALVSNGIIFWYEEDGKSIGWQVKATSTSRDAEGATIWKEGTIHSTNHGRLVILPYIKEDGEKVKGHTKNGPNDGRALPRHPDHYVDIPFASYEGDLMIRLFGELPYE